MGLVKEPPASLPLYAIDLWARLERSGFLWVSGLLNTSPGMVKAMRAVGYVFRPPTGSWPARYQRKGWKPNETAQPWRRNNR